MHTLSGRLRLALPERDLVLGPGDTVLFQPGAPQDFGGDPSSDAWEVVWTHFVPAPHWLELVQWPELAPGVLHMRVATSALLERIETCLVDTDRLAVSGLPQGHPARPQRPRGRTALVGRPESGPATARSARRRGDRLPLPQPPSSRHRR